MNKKSISRGFLVCLVIAALAFVLPRSSFGKPPRSKTMIYDIGRSIYLNHFKDDNFSCDTCHRNINNWNFQLTRAEDELCYDCHDRMDAQEWVHGPIGVGQCSICHDPHGSKKRNFLTRKGDGLCFYCHNEVRMKMHVSEKKIKSCASCHDSHSAETQNLLKKK